MTDTNPRPCVCLIGAGTVGRAILAEHLKAGFDVLLIDVNDLALRAACQSAVEEFSAVRAESIPPIVNEMLAVRLAVGEPTTPSFVIESIPENLSLKQSLFTALRQALGPDVILASNTSNLRIASVFDLLGNDPHCCGLHFFMPVAERPLVECVATEHTSSMTLAACQSHAARLGKQALFVQDSPGFVVNRLLAPYLNQSLVMLEHGVDANQLADAAKRFGMPMSPLALIDAIGVRTAFDSGRVFWQSFPQRLDPSPILPGMIKAARRNQANRIAFLESTGLSENANQVIGSYQRATQHWSTAAVAQMIAIPMWIEAAEVLSSGIVDNLKDVELAMSGGLGYRGDSFFGYFDSLGKQIMLHYLLSSSETFRGLRATDELLSELHGCDCPSDCVQRYVELRRGNSV